MVVAIDIGGTKTLIVTFDKAGHALTEERFATDHNPQTFLNELEKRLSALRPETFETLAIAAPGLVDSKQGIVLYAPNLGWRDLPLKAELEKRYHCPIYVENDAKIAGLGATHALDTLPQLSLYVTIGTGIGTGIITNGKIDPALSRAEGGHMVFETEKDLLQTWEQFASGRAITQQFGRLAGDITNTEDWEKIAKNLCVGFRVLIPALQPDVVIVGGGVGTHFTQFANYLTTLLRQQIPAFIPIPSFVQAIDPEKAVIHGCYYYALTFNAN